MEHDDVVGAGHLRIEADLLDALVGRADIVIKSLAENFIAIRGLSGASIMGNGAVCLMLDCMALVELASDRTPSVGLRT